MDPKRVRQAKVVEWNIMKMCGHEEATSGNARSDTSSLSTTKTLHWRTKQVLRGDTYVITDIQNSVGCLVVSVASREVRSTSVWRASLMSQCTCKKKRKRFKTKPTVTFQREDGRNNNVFHDMFRNMFAKKKESWFTSTLSSIWGTSKTLLKADMCLQHRRQKT